MAVLTYDSHEFIKELRAVGFEERQAEVLFTVVRSLQDSRLEDVSTRRDVRDLEFKMDTRFKELDTKLATSLKELELRMVVKLGGMIIIVVGLVFGLLRIWPLPVQYIPAPGQEYRLPPAVAPGR